MLTFVARAPFIVCSACTFIYIFIAITKYFFFIFAVSNIVFVRFEKSQFIVLFALALVSSTNPDITIVCIVFLFSALRFLIERI